MNVIQSFSVSPSKKDSPLKHSYGWLSAEYHWLCWVLSALKVRATFGDIELVTDEIGKSILIDKLELPYTKVRLYLETLNLDKYPPELWALSKLCVYANQSEPFLHIDGDIIFGNKFKNVFEKKALIVQNIEKNIFYKVIDSINTHFACFPEFLKAEYFVESSDFYSINAGLIGGEDIDFFKSYVAEAFNFVDKNLDYLDYLDEKLGYLNVIFEQLFFYHFAKIQGKNIFSYLPNPVEDAFYNEVMDIDNYPNIELIHPVGSHKKGEKVCRKIASILYDEYPNYYYKVIQMLSETEHPFHLRFYQLVEWNGQKEMIFRKNKSEILQTLQPKHINVENCRLNLNIQHIELDHLPHNLNKFAENERVLLTDAYEYDSAIQDFFYKNTTDSEKLLKSYYSQKANFTIDDSTVEEDLYESLFRYNDEIQIVETKFDWEAFLYNSEITDFIEGNENYIALIFDVLELKVISYTLSGLECVIFETLENESTLEQLLLEVSNCFDQEEIENDYDSFKKMVIDTLKNLLKRNIIFKYKTLK